MLYTYKHTFFELYNLFGLGYITGLQGYHEIASSERAVANIKDNK